MWTPMITKGHVRSARSPPPPGCFGRPSGCGQLTRDARFGYECRPAVPLRRRRCFDRQAAKAGDGPEVRHGLAGDDAASCGGVPDDRRPAGRAILGHGCRPAGEITRSRAVPAGPRMRTVGANGSDGTAPGTEFPGFPGVSRPHRTVAGHLRTVRLWCFRPRPHDGRPCSAGAWFGD